jgi:hypothetical protein
MLKRCYNERSQHFKSYGGRGITVCDRWRFGENGQHPFECFIADVGRRPSVGLSIDRIDNNNGYYPGNVRWTTPLQQARNTRKYQGGIHHLKSGKFRAHIAGVDRQFKTIEAARAAKSAAAEC